jgi:hypothetical protein
MNVNREICTITNEIQINNYEYNEINEDYCSRLLKQGAYVIGYSLYLAKTIVYLDDKLGFENFCIKNNLQVDTAERYVLLYNAKKALGNDNLLPNSYQNYAYLPGDTPQEKANSYSRIKLFYGREEVNTKDIRIFRYANARGIIDSNLVTNFIFTMRKQSDVVLGTYFKCNKQAGLSQILDAIDSGLDDAEICGIITGKSSRKKASIRVTSRKSFDALSENDKYERLMYLEKLLLKYTTEKEIHND